MGLAAAAHAVDRTAKLSHGAPDGPGPAASPSDGATAVAAAVYAAAAVSPRRPLFSVAPMMDWTEVNFRQLCRLLSKHTWLWTEMVVDKVRRCAVWLSRGVRRRVHGRG